MAIKVVFPAGEKSVIVQGLYQWDYGQTLEIECADIGFEIMEVHFACPNMTMAIPRPCTFTNGIGTVPIPDQCLEQGEAITAWVCRIDDKQGHTIKTITLPITKRTKPIRTHDVPEELVDKYSELLTEVTETVNALKDGNITATRAVNAESANTANTAESAEYANYATSAETAHTSNYATETESIQMRLVAQCTITNGQGNVGVALAVDTPYLAVFVAADEVAIDNYINTIGSGIIITSSHSNICTCGISVSLGAVLQNWSMAESHVAVISKGNGFEADTTVQGELYIYTFGSIV